MTDRPIFKENNEDSESSLGKLVSKSRDSPFVPIGMAGFLAVCGIGAYKYKNRGTMSTSLFLMQLRVAAQGTVVGCLTLGLVYTMAQEYIFNKPPSAEIKDATSSSTPSK